MPQKKRKPCWLEKENASDQPVEKKHGAHRKPTAVQTQQESACNNRRNKTTQPEECCSSNRRNTVISHHNLIVKFALRVHDVSQMFVPWVRGMCTGLAVHYARAEQWQGTCKCRCWQKRSAWRNTWIIQPGARRLDLQTPDRIVLSSFSMQNYFSCKLLGVRQHP